MLRADNLVATLSTMFANLEEKCTFRVPKGNLLGYMVSERGIEANHDKIAAIANMAPSMASRAFKG